MNVEKRDFHGNEMVKIGVVADQLGISIRTIHMYERKGLFLANKNAAGTRYFTEQDIAWLVEIRKMIHSGISITSIQRLLSLIPCWEHKGCHHNEKRGCPVIHDETAPCWSNKRNLCNETVHECRQCAVYAMRFRVQMLKTSFDIRLKKDSQPAV